jgi:ABC-type hemin transport system ATPase subunit
VGHLDVNGVSFSLPDGRPLLGEVTFRVPDGTSSALIGPNGTGKTTLLRIVAGDLDAHEGAVGRSGGVGVMRSSSARYGTPPRCVICWSVCPRPGSGPPLPAVDASELAMMQDRRRTHPAAVRTGAVGLGRRRRLRRRDPAGTSARWPPWACRSSGPRWREVRTLSGGEQKRLELEALLARARTRCCCSTSRTTTSTCPGKRWLEDSCARAPRRC